MGEIGLTPGPRKSVVSWIIIGLAIVSVVFVIVFLTDKIKLTKVSKQARQAESMGLDKVLPDLKCNFADDKAAIEKAKEDKDVSPCFCIQAENVRFRCQEDAQNEGYYAQARAQFDGKFCELIKNNSSLKTTCESVASSGTEYLKKQNPEKLAYIYLQNGNYDGAISTLQGSTEVSSMLFLALSYADKALLEHKENELIPKAQALIDKAVLADPENPEVYRMQGYIYEIKPDLVKAIESYGKSLELNPDYILALTGRAHAYNMLGDLQRALEDFRKAAGLDKDKKDMVIYSNLCRLETSRDDLVDEGIGNCRLVISSPLSSAQSKSEADQIMANLYARQERYVVALAFLENARTLAPNNPNLLVSLAEVYTAQKDFSKAEASAQKALDIDPLKTVAYAALAEAYLSEKNYGEAEVKALVGLEVIDKDPSLLVSNKPAHRQQLNYILAETYKAQGSAEKEGRYREAGDKAVASEKQN